MYCGAQLSRLPCMQKGYELILQNGRCTICRPGSIQAIASQQTFKINFQSFEDWKRMYSSNKSESGHLSSTIIPSKLPSCEKSFIS